MNTLEFTLAGDCITLCQLLKLTGLCPSGGSAKLVIAAGEVRVDDEIETRKTCKIRAGQIVVYDDTRIRVLPA